MVDYLGYRAKMGVTTPSTNTVVQPEYDDMRPPGVTNHLGRMHIENIPTTDDNSFDNGGALFESPDGGTTWTQRDIPVNLSSPLNGIFFLDADHGWTYGNVNYRTVDGGATWIEMPPLGSTYFMEFETTDFGLTTGNFGAYVSRDGGVSWTPSPNDMTAFDFADAQTGLGAGPAGIFRSGDGGATFTSVFAGEGHDVAFLSTSVAVAIVDSSLLRSTDGGQTWTVTGNAEGRNRLSAISSDAVLAWGRSGNFPSYDDRVFRSGDGGQTWTDLGTIIADGALAYTVVDAQTVVAHDRAGSLYRSADGGQTWTQTFASPGPQPGFLSSATPAFPDAQTGYFGYGPGFVIKTTDGGATWTQTSSGSGNSLADVDRTAAGNLIAVGASGTILTSDGSGAWVTSPVATSLDFVAVQTLGGQDAVALDEGGTAWFSTDGGATWTPAASTPTGLDGRDLHFTSLQEGWIIGGGNTGNVLFQTNDGGATWTPATGFGGAYVSIDIEGQNGWAANVGGRYYRTTDGGATWEQGDLPGSPFQIADMDFADVSTGYAVGWQGYAARSDDGGATWQVLPTPNTTDRFSDIYVLGPNELWLSTTDDVAYYSATGGQNWAVLPIGSAGFGSFSAIAASAAGDAWTVGAQGYIELFQGPPPPPLNRPPVAAFDFNTTGMTVDFTDRSSDPDGIIVSWRWDFGDGTGSTEPNPTHTYTEANTYIVRLTVTDDDGDSTRTVRFITVQPGPGGTFGDFTEVTPLDSLFVTGQDEDFWVISTAPADYDGDGDLDVAVVGYYVVYNQSVDYRLVLIRNDGELGPGEWEFAYIDLPFDTLSAGRSDLAWGDADGDGDPDLAVGSDGATVLFRNDAGTLLPTDTRLPGYFEDNDQAFFDLRSLSWADYDNDGDQDLLIPSVWDGGAFRYRTALMRNDGPNGTGGVTFTETDSVFAPTAHAQSIWADDDGDGDLDLLLINMAPLTDDGFILRYRNDGNGVFTPDSILGSLTLEHGDAQWGDYDADGDLDILVAGDVQDPDGTFDTALRIYRNDAGTMTEIPVIDTLAAEGWFDVTSASWGDYDTDGDMDILLAGTWNPGSQIEGRARIYDNANGTFSWSGNDLPAPLASGSRGGTFSWFDIDIDGDLDYFIAGQYYVPGGNNLVEAQMHVYRNDAAGQNNAPTAPAGMNAAVQPDSSVILTWNAASDDHTPSAALTYDLLLFRDGAPVTNPQRLPEPGNVSSVTTWQLAGLPAGRYAWTLQAVDAAYAGSAAAVGEFTIGDVTGIDGESGLPQSFAFHENYPNPFNPSTTFRFELPDRAVVELTVYNLRGQVVAKLLNESRRAGSHELRWEASGLPSGTYFVRMSTAGFSQTQKVILLK